MCGIVGFTGRGSEAVLKKMTATLKHRGPDASGHFFDEKIALGHTRLSIIDTSTKGNQPMFTPHKDVVIVYNGEIYNFKELRQDLTSRKKINFRSNSDTEVLLHLYQEFGLDMFKKLNGMFALALYDIKKDILLLARDRFGKKPLYYTIIKNDLIFASELKALHHYPDFHPELDHESLSKYLLYEYVPTPHCIFAHVHKLEPATYALWEHKTLSKHEYWRMHFDEQKISLDEATHRLDMTLNNAVKHRLIADVPLGVFLSGGLDSSTIAYYAQKNSDQKIKTFSIGFDEKSYDESPYAALVAEQLGTDHYNEIVMSRDALNIIPSIAEISDEPLADASIIPTHLLSKFTRSKVTVALGGDGADELLAGYPTFLAHKAAPLYNKIPRFLHNYVIKQIAKHIPTSDRDISLDFAVNNFIRDVHCEPYARNQKWLGTFTQEAQDQLLHRDVLNSLTKHDVLEDLEPIRSQAVHLSRLNKLIYLYLKTYLPDDILVKVDRASMYNSLEIRAPFLDPAVVDLINTLPEQYKMKGYKSKVILKRLMKDRLPKEIVNRKKKGFGIPLSQWLRGELKDLCHDLLSKQRIEQQRLFNYACVQQLLSDHMSRRRNNRKELWTLMVFQLWYDKWIR